MNSNSSNSLGCLGCLVLIAFYLGSIAVVTWIILSVAKGVLGA